MCTFQFLSTFFFSPLPSPLDRDTDGRTRQRGATPRENQEKRDFTFLCLPWVSMATRCRTRPATAGERTYGLLPRLKTSDNIKHVWFYQASVLWACLCKHSANYDILILLLWRHFAYYMSISTELGVWTLLHSHQIIYADNISLTPSGQGHYNGKRWHWLSHTHTHTHCSNQITLCWYSCWAGHNLMRTSVVRSNAITGLMQDLACTQTVTHRAGGRSALQQKLSLSRQGHF